MQKGFVGEKQAVDALHRLAAMNWRQWTRWQKRIIPLLEAEDQAALDALERGEYPEDIIEVLKASSSGMLEMVSSSVGKYIHDAYSNSDAVHAGLNAHKSWQFGEWVRQARTWPAAQYDYWKRQMLLSFIELPPEQQAYEYPHAYKDLEVFARITGLELPHPLPEVEPFSVNLSRRKIARIQRKHRNLNHQGYGALEGFLKARCQLCNGDATLVKVYR